MSTHTPGPWVAVDGCIEAKRFGVDEAIATTYGLAPSAGRYSLEDFEYGAETEANARVMAAAPMLLAALERVLDTVEHAYHTNDDADGSLWADVLACREAIAKATGATP